MAGSRNKLFDSWTFKLALPEPFSGSEYSGGQSKGLSRYNHTGRVRQATLHAPSLRALLAYARLVNAVEKGESTEQLGAIGHQGETFRMAEYVSGNRTDCVVFNTVTGKFIVGQFENGSGNSKACTLSSGGSSGSSLFFCLMPVFETDDEFRDGLAEFKEAMANGWPDMEAAFETALRLCDNMYRRIQAAKSLEDAGVQLTVPSTGNIAVLTPLALTGGTYAPTGTLYGEFSILNTAGTGASVKVYTHHEFTGHYRLTSERILSEREQTMVPQLPDWYIIPHEVVRVCEHARMTSGTEQPMRNFMFRGEAGTGKTMGAQAIAAGLNLPYTLMTCHANTEITDLIGQFIPDAEKNSSLDSDREELPGISDIIMHPPSVYKMLTGEYDEAKTGDDVLEKLIEKAVSRLAVREEKHKARIRYVETPLMEAIRYGYLCELQEPACIASPGVLVGLNALLDHCQSITLPTGEQVKRHPDTVIVVTTNSGYAGCRDMNQSVISRMDLVYDMAAPDTKTMVKRVMKVTGFQDEQEAVKMALVVKKIAEHCRQTMIEDGSCGMREFKSWVLSTMITKDPYESALHTVISSASADAESRAELTRLCLEEVYARTV